MARKFFYSGDLNIEHGGYFYCLDTWHWGYVDAVRVTPCSDAGAADNCFWIDRLTVNLRNGAELDNILSVCGWTTADLPKGAQRRHMIIDAHIAYGAYDCDSECIQIGARQSEYGEPIRPDKVLRGNTSLRRYARNIAADKYA